MSSGELQYISDSILIEKIHSLNSVLYKNAGLADDLFSGVSSAVNGFVKSNINTSSTGGLIKSVLNLLTPGVFFRIHPLLGVVYSAASEFGGFSATSILSSIVNSIKPIILSGKQVTPDQVNEAGLMAGGGEVTASLFDDVRDIEKRGELSKYAMMVKEAKPSVLRGLFGSMKKKPRAKKSLAAGVITWFVKTILMGAGLLAVSGVAKSLITDEEGSESSGSNTVIPDQQNVQQNEVQQSQNQPSQVSQKNKDSYQTNQMPTRYVPVRGGSVENTIINWAKRLYPNLSGYEDIIKETSSFKSVAESVSKNYTPGKPLMGLPIGQDERSLVNQFIGDVKKEIQKDQK